MIVEKNVPMQYYSLPSDTTLESFKEYTEKLPIGVHLAYATRQIAKELGIAPAASDAFCHIFIFKRSNSLTLCEATPYNYRYGSYVLLKDTNWSDGFHLRENGGGYKCSLSSFEGGGVNDSRIQGLQPCLFSQHNDFSHETRFSGFHRNFACALQPLVYNSIELCNYIGASKKWTIFNSSVSQYGWYVHHDCDSDRCVNRCIQSFQKFKRPVGGLDKNNTYNLTPRKGVAA